MNKSACPRASLIPYPVIAAAASGDPEAVNRVIQHYSGYIAALSMRTTYRFGNRSFVVETVFRKDAPDTLGSVLLRLMKADSEKK